VREFGAIEDYRADDLVVALPDRDIVRQALTGLHVAIGTEDDDEQLGLALLPLVGLAEADNEWRRDRGLVQRATDAKRHGGAPDGTRLSALDLLLRKLRERFAAANDGWVPDIGKNRVIAPVRGFPHVDGCAEGNPGGLGLADPVQPPVGGDRGWQPCHGERGRGVRVGLLDTRLYPNSLLAGGYLASPDDLLPASGSLYDALDGHGTFVAGLILQRAPGAGLIVRPVLSHKALGSTWDVAKAMVRFAGTGVQILNLSFGCYTDDGQPPLILAKAVSVLSPQILLVAAAGNHGNIEELRKADDPLAAPWTKNLKDTTPVWPAAFADVIAVGADDGDGVADFSPKAAWVDVIAPGVNLESTYLVGEVRLATTASDGQIKASGGKKEEFHGLARWQGTSFAAANVSGAVAARIRPGCNARQALEAVLADPDSGIKRFEN
jgi:subtilisin family serine protease